MGLLDLAHDYKLRAFDNLGAPEMKAPTVDGTAGSTTVEYVATLVTLVGETTESAAVSITNAPDTLSGINRVKVELEALPAGATARFYKKSGSNYYYLGEAAAGTKAMYDEGQTLNNAIEPPDTDTSGREGWVMVLPHSKRRLQRSELVDMQAIYLKFIKDLGDSIHKNGDVISGCAFTDNGGNSWSVSAGEIYFEGLKVPVPSGTLELAGSGTEIAGVTVTPAVITHDSDVVLRSPDMGVDWQYAAPGADRMILQVAWGVDQADQIGIQEFVDGSMKMRQIATERTNLQIQLARRLNDSLGSFIVQNFQYRMLEDPDDGDKMKLRVSRGKAYPEGWEVELIGDRFVIMDKARDCGSRNNSTIGEFLLTGGGVTGISTENFDVDGLSIKLKVDSGNSHTVTFSGNGKTATQVAADIEASINAYPTSQDLVDCSAVSGKVKVQATKGRTLVIEAVASDAYTVLGLSTGTYSPTGQRIYPCNDRFIKTVSDLNYTTEIVEQLTHDGLDHIDDLANTGVLSILGAANTQANCYDEKWDYQNGVDFGRTGNSIDFSLYGGAEPGNGGTYYVKYRYNRNATKGVRYLVEVTDAQVVKGASGGKDTIVFTGATSAKRVYDNSTISGLSGSASNLYEILRVNDSAGQSQDGYAGQYELVTNSTALSHSASEIDWDGATDEPLTSATYYITFRFWYHQTEGDYVGADSYDMYESIELSPDPSISLRDCVDFRTTGATFPAASSGVILDYDYYQSRIDSLFLDREGGLTIVKGEPADVPEPPSVVTGPLHLAVIFLQPYTYDVSKVVIRPNEVQRTTHIGIQQLKKRLERTEYYQAMNALEKETALSSAAATAQGIFTDPSSSFSRVDFNFSKNGIKHSASLDRRRQCWMLASEQDPKVISVDDGNSSNVKRVGNTIMLDYTPSVYQSSMKASEKMNINPDNLFSFANGVLEITPAVDVFMDTEQLPDLTVDFDRDLMNRLFGVDFTPEELSVLEQETWRNVRTGQTWAERFGGASLGSAGSNAWSEFAANETPLTMMARDPNHWDTVNRSVASSGARRGPLTDVWAGQITNATVLPDRYEVDLGDRVVDISQARMMRTKDEDGNDFEISCTCRLLLPGQDYAVSIDGKVVDFVVTGSSSQGSSTYEGKTTVAADSSGALTGKFVMPTGVPVGQKIVKVFNASAPDSSNASAMFVSQGFMQRRQSSTMGFATERTITETVDLGQVFFYNDPLAQTFLVTENNVYLSAVGVYFASKSDTIPVTCEIRETLNGYPTKKVLASKTLNPGEVNVSDDATAETIFTFEHVLNYAIEEYCIVLVTQCDDYEIWVSNLGGFDVTTGEQITSHPHGGTLFHSPNASTWHPLTKMDMKFKLYKANFQNNCQMVFDNITGVQAGKLAVLVEQFLAPGTRVQWSYSTDGGTSYTPFNPNFDTTLSTLATQVKLICDVTSSGGNFAIIENYAGIMFLLHKDAGDVIYPNSQFSDDSNYPNKVRIICSIDADGVGGSGTRSFTPYYSIDDGETWVEVGVVPGYTPVAKDIGFYEYEFETPDQGTVTGATNATPIVVTCDDHRLKDNAIVTIAGVGGNTAANGDRIVKNATTNTFELYDADTGNAVAGNGAYTSGGTIDLKEFSQARGRIKLTTTNKAQSPAACDFRMICSRET